MGAVKIRRKTENRSPDTREKITSRFKMSGSRVPVTMRDFFFDDPFFKNSWEDFDKVRNAMFTESRDMWKKFDDDFRNMACMSNNIMLESPALNTDFSNNVDIFKSKDNEVIRVKEDESKLEVSLDTSQYRPDELKVSVNEGVLVVEGKHEEKAEDGSKMVSRMFSRKYTLPPSTKQEEVASNLSSDGVLVITAPKKNLAIK